MCGLDSWHDRQFRDGFWILGTLDIRQFDYVCVFVSLTDADILFAVIVAYSYRRSAGKFVVKRADLDHKNHDISAEIFSLYPDQRRPTGHTANTADHLLQVGYIGGLSVIYCR